MSAGFFKRKGDEVMNTLSQTPNASRTHIGIFGRRNAGKSSLINALTGQNTALVSEVEGTTTDPVYKAMELYPLGPCVLIDTAGFDDLGELGRMRVEKTREVLEKTDIALLVLVGDQEEYEQEQEWVAEFQRGKKPFLIAVNQSDRISEVPEWVKAYPYVSVSAKEKENIGALKELMVKVAPQELELQSLTAHLVSEDDVVLLVMPQDIQAPKGRLILPQVQTIRDLLDRKAIVMCVTTDKLTGALYALKEPPKVIITDSQVFGEVYEKCPKESLLTSFSVLMARFKGDIDIFLKGAEAVDHLTQQDKVLILEACSHNPMDGDIGREKIPAMLRKKVGPGISIEIRSGNDIPKDLTPYSLVIHCGGCMFNRAHVLSRIARCEAQGVPVTNYGIFIAKMKGILEKIAIK